MWFLNLHLTFAVGVVQQEVSGTARHCLSKVKASADVLQGPDLQNILQQSYDYLTIMPKLRSTYDGRLIYKTSYEGRKAFLRYDSLAIS